MILLYSNKKSNMTVGGERWESPPTFPPNDIVYDVVYWVTMHRELEFNIDFINNVKKFNKHNNFIICLHLNNEQYELHKKDGVYYDKNILVTPIHYNKDNSITGITPYIEMFDYVESVGYKYKYCMIANTSSRFIRQVNIDPNDLNYNISITENPYTSSRNYKHQNLCFRNRNECKPLLDYIKNNNIYLIFGYNSGITFTYEFYKYFINYFKTEIMPLLYRNIGSFFQYPEWVFHTFTFYLTGREPFSYGVSKPIYDWTLKNLRYNIIKRLWTVKEIESILMNNPKIFLIKRVDDINSESNKFIQDI